MSDNLFLTLILIACYFLEDAFSKQDTTQLVIGIIFAWLSLLQRQFGLLLLVLIIGYCAIQLIKGFKRFLLVGVALSLLLILTTVVVHQWRIGNLHFQYAPQIVSNFSLGIRVLILQYTLFFMGLILTPIFLTKKYINLTVSNKKTTSANTLIGFLKSIIPYVLIFYMVYQCIDDLNAPFVGNLFSAFGVFKINEVLLGDRIVIFPMLLRMAFCIYALFFLFYINNKKLNFNFTFNNWQSIFKQYHYGSLTISFGLLYFLVLIARGDIFDRYLIPLLPGVIVWAEKLLFNLKSRKTQLIPIMTTLVIVLFDVTVVKDYFSWNEAKWSLAEQARQLTSDTNLIDGGYEWNGLHFKYEKSPPLSADRLAKYIVSFSECPGVKTINSKEWFSIWPPHDRKIYLLEK